MHTHIYTCIPTTYIHTCSNTYIPTYTYIHTCMISHPASGVPYPVEGRPDLAARGGSAPAKCVRRTQRERAGLHQLRTG